MNITPEMKQSLGKKHKHLDVAVEYVNRLCEEGEKLVHSKLLVSEAYNNRHLSKCDSGIQRRISSLLGCELKLKVHIKPSHGQKVYHIPENGITMERLQELGF